MKNYEELQVWKKAHELTLEVYRISKSFPKEELYGLTNQIRRSAASIPTNIAEGCGRNSDAELARFLEIASGSASESNYQLLLAKDLGYISADKFEIAACQLIEVRKMLNTFIRKLKPNR